MKKVFGYTRVSTIKQGEHGVSLQEQKAAILRHAERNNFEIVDWFEERQTAAKSGRPLFNQMLRLLRRRKADGIVLHKIDRGARNLKDWADLGELIDQGIEIHFANEGLDLHSRGGRLSADIQAVVAADYVRNLREETRKGFYGRIKQGFFPLPAPLGYLDCGKAKAKALNPATAPLVRAAFELYASGRYNLHTLLAELHARGLRNRRGNDLSLNGLSKLLNNPFYTGLIRLKRTGETFPGAHDPLITPPLFAAVQEVLRGRTNTRPILHAFTFRRFLKCAGCQYSLIGELQKGRVYYRCHIRSCPTTALREDVIDESALACLLPLQLEPEEYVHVTNRLRHLGADWQRQAQDEAAARKLAGAKIEDRLIRLTDAYVDGLLDKPVFEERRSLLVLERQRLAEGTLTAGAATASAPEMLTNYLELAHGAYVSYEMASPAERRQLLETFTSNRTVDRKMLVLELRSPFRELATRWENAHGGPYRDVPRTWDRLINKLIRLFTKNPYPNLVRRRDDNNAAGSENQEEQVA